jgi:ketosteroid isomerase-like protein
MPSLEKQTPAQLIGIARKWLACFETHDVEALVALYAPDAKHTSPKLRVQRPETGGFLIGRDALRAWWADAFRRIPQLRYVETQLTADTERVFMEYVRHAPGDADMPVAEVLECKDGLIVASRVFHG